MSKLHKKPKSAEGESAEHKPHTHKWNDENKCEICGASPIPGRAYDDMFRQGSRPSA
jgi:hypothetical protein